MGAHHDKEPLPHPCAVPRSSCSRRQKSPEQTGPLYEVHLCGRITGNGQFGRYRIDPVVAKLPSTPYHHLFCPHQPHNSPQSIHVLHAKIGSAKPGKCQDKRRAIPTDPKIHHKAPQLTTNPEDRFFPQRTGPTNKLDFGPLRKAPSCAVLSPHLR